MVNQRLLLQCEYLVAGNRILRSHLSAKLRLSNPERSTLAEIGKRLGRKHLAEVACVAKPETILAWSQGGRFVTYDLVLCDGDVLYPVPWARDASASFLLSESDTRTALERAGYKAVLWRDDTEAAGDWFRTVMSAQPSRGPNLALVMGPDFPAMTGNLARNLRENRLGVLSAVLTHD